MFNSNIRVMIGLESHIQLKTKSKLFCSCHASSSNAAPNENTCEICMGFPGSKPTLNREAVKKAIVLAKILNCKINEYSRFARKIYFYPDLPKGFQITQYDEPLAVQGEFSININENKKTINITRVHIEEDPGKIEYVDGNINTAKEVLIDYNRSGLPLCEVVTEPDFSSIEEAVIYVKKLFHLLSYLGLIDPSQEGVMRTDANISIDGGARVELKNISGSDVLEKSLKAELNRQLFLNAQGKDVGRETRVYSEETSTTILLRKKEYEEEYGYILEPDLLPIVLSQDFLKKVLSKMKKLPEEAEREIINIYKLPKQIAHQLAFKRGLYEYFEKCLKIKNAQKLAKPSEQQKSDQKFIEISALISRWLVSDFLKCANWHNFEIEQCPESEKFLEFIKLIENSKISEREGKEILKKIFDSPQKSLSELLTKEEIDLKDIIKQVLKENMKAVGMIKSGDEKPINFLLGQVLRKTSFKGDPKNIRKIIEESIR